MNDLTVVVPFRDGHESLPRLLASLPKSLPVIVVDDASIVPLQLKRKNMRVIRLEADARGYFAGAVNTGAANCDTDILILNQDATLSGDEWQVLIAEKRNEYAVIGDGVMKHPAWPRGYVQGTCMFIRRDAWEKVGRFNAADYPLWGATCEWQLRACRAGYKALPLAPFPGLSHRDDGAAFGAAITQALKDEPDKKGLFIRTAPAVSVIVPCYNYGRYLQDAVNSLLGGPTSLGDFAPQSFQSFEVIIVDDASTDGSEKIGAALADDWKGVRFIRREVKGDTAQALNTGIAVSYGKYVTALSADDMMESWRLEMLYRLAMQNSKRVIYDDMRIFKGGQRDKVLILKEYVERVKDKTTQFDFNGLLTKNWMHAGIFYEREAWRKVGGYPANAVNGREDWTFNIALGAAGYCGLKASRAGYLYRREGQNRTLSHGGAEWHGFYLERLKKIFPDLYKGVRPVGCCGGKSQVVSGKTHSVNAKSQAASQNGTVLLEYVGGNAGTQEWHSRFTPKRYLFNSGRRRFGWVDARDADYLVGLLSNHRPLFVRAVTADAKRVPA